MAAIFPDDILKGNFLNENILTFDYKFTEVCS